MKKVYLVVAGALLFLLAACVPGATPTVRTQLPKPINFQVTEADGGYHASWMYIADLGEVSAFNLYREETLQNGSRLGAENRVFRVTWGPCENELCLTVTDGDVDEEEAQPIGAGTLECNATGCYFGYTDTEGLNPTSTYRYYLRMVNAEGRLDNQIIITEEERRQQEAAEEAAAEEAAPQPSEEGSGEENGEPEGGTEENGESEENGEGGENGESGEPEENGGSGGEEEQCEEGAVWVPTESGGYCMTFSDEEGDYDGHDPIDEECDQPGTFSLLAAEIGWEPDPCHPDGGTYNQDAINCVDGGGAWVDNGIDEPFCDEGTTYPTPEDFADDKDGCIANSGFEWVEGAGCRWATGKVN